MSEEISEIKAINIVDEMQNSYLDFAMSVIVSRALPDAKDGMKPVHRRILYAMYESSCHFNKPYRKSARIVGEVMGKYHPHGDSAIYDSLVRMAQSFSLRNTLIDGQGNFGSIDGDSAAAMRYTESRLAKISHSLLADIEFDTVNFRPNYDGSENEPEVLPARFPNLLVNGSSGIAVGMATNIPPHNLGEVIDACCLYIDNHDITKEELLGVVKGPDFPTGGTICGVGGVRSALLTGRGSVMMRGKNHYEEINGRQAIIITEIPYQVNKARLIEKIAECVREKKIEGIAALRDESNKEGMRIVIECKKDATVEIVLNQLYSFTSLQTSFGVNMLAINDNTPQLMNILDIIKIFVNFREVVVVRRTEYLLSKAKDKAELLIGLAVAVININKMIEIIRTAPDTNTAKENLLSQRWPVDKIIDTLNIASDLCGDMTDNLINITEIQAKAILEMRLSKLTALEHHKIHVELKEIFENISGYNAILNSREELLRVVKNELLEVKEEFGTPRLTQIDLNAIENDIEDLIEHEDMVITVTMSGFIKRVPLATYRAQKRGGKGRSGMNMAADDVVTQIFVADTHTEMLFFSTTGQVYKLKAYKLPLATPQTKGRALVNIFSLANNETINNILALPEKAYESDLYIVFATQSGNIRRNDIMDFKNIHSGGKIAIKLDEGDALIGVKLCEESDHILVASYLGKVIRFPLNVLRVFKSRTSDGVKAIKLANQDKVVSLSVLNGTNTNMQEREEILRIPLEERIRIANDGEYVADIDMSHERIKLLCQEEDFILTITENGFGKRTSSHEYRMTNRGGQGIMNIVTSERNGNVIASFSTIGIQEIILITNKGKLIRTPIRDIRVIGRNTQGVKIFHTEKDEYVISVALIRETNDDMPDEEDMPEAFEENSDIAAIISPDSAV